MKQPVRTPSVASMSDNRDPMVSCAWLAERLEAPDIRVVDGSWFMPNSGQDAAALYAERRIPGAVFFDIDAIADASNQLPHMLPSPEMFSSRMKRMGIGDGAHVVVYDNTGIFGAARVWWTFRAMGHEGVSVLDGGFPAWEAGGYPIEDGTPIARGERHFTSQYRADLVRDLSEMRRLVDAKNATILDARPAPRFRGEAPEPRPGLRSGHMPGALSTPTSLFVDEKGFLRPRAELEAALAKTGANLKQPIVCSCGSGIAASVVALALARLGRWDASVYDGSWTEWGAQADTPVATGTE